MEKQEILEKRKKYLYPTKIPYYKEPIQLVKAEGSYVFDENGKRYLDVIGGIVSISVGHNHPKIVAKLKSLLDEGAIQHTTFLYLQGHMEELAESLANVAPGELSQCYFTNSGSEANEMAVMTARVYTGNQMVVSLRHGYHGGTNVPLGLCGHSTWKFPSQPQASVAHAKAPYCYRCPYQKTPEGCSLECANDVKEVIETATHGEIAAFICEPILGVGGFIDPPLEYHRKVKEIAANAGGLYISDEVQTGVGRTGKTFFAIEESGVTPDIISMAKGIGNGAPLGAVITRADIAEKMKGTAHFNTFGGDPYQSMQAKMVIDIIQEENLIKNAHEQGEYLRSAFRDMQKDFSFIGDVRGRGLLVGLELVKDLKTKEIAPDYAASVMEYAKEEGLLIGKGGLYGNIIRIAPSMAITRNECDEMLEKMKKAFLKIS